FLTLNRSVLALLVGSSVFASLVGSYHSLFNDGHDDAPHFEVEKPVEKEVKKKANRGHRSSVGSINRKGQGVHGSEAPSPEDYAFNKSRRGSVSIPASNAGSFGQEMPAFAKREKAAAVKEETGQEGDGEIESFVKDVGRRLSTIAQSGPRQVAMRGKYWGVKHLEGERCGV
ncbi:hypothetical protein T484DRAFT_1830465, partial [Baffinella frigidus]